MSQPEVWLRGPISGICPALMPVAHALLQAREDGERVAATLTVEELWRKPGGAASAGFHLRHIAGSVSRLLTYARGGQLDESQRRALASEQEPGHPPQDSPVLVQALRETVDSAMRQLQETPAESLAEERRVGRAGLPSTVLGLLFHAAEHAQRHTGQLITTVKIVQSGKGGE